MGDNFFDYVLIAVATFAGAYLFGPAGVKGVWQSAAWLAVGNAALAYITGEVLAPSIPNALKQRNIQDMVASAIKPHHITYNKYHITSQF